MTHAQSPALPSSFYGRDMQILGRLDQQSVWHPDKYQLLTHRAQLSQFLDQHQHFKEPKPDIHITLGDHSVAMLHSEVGIAHSGYLRKRYAKEATGEPKLLQVNDMTEYDANCVRRVINFFYNGELPCSLAEIPELLAICDAFQVSSLRVVIEKFIVQKAADLNCLLDCWNISCHRKSDLSTRAREFVLSYVIHYLEEAILDPRFAQLDQGAVEALLQRDSLPVRSEADVLRIALMYYLRRKGHTSVQSLLNVVRYNCDADVIIRMRQDILSVNDEYLRHCFEQNCAYGMWQMQRNQYADNIWPVTEVPSPRGLPDAECGWIAAQFFSLIGSMDNPVNI